MRGLVVVLVLLMAGCGTKEGSSAGFEVPDQGDGGVYVIHLTDERAFDPAKAKVPTDAIVSFHFGLENCDVRSEQPGGPDSRTQGYANGIYPRGESYNWPAPSQPAQFDIYCSRHPSMTGVVKVG